MDEETREFLTEELLIDLEDISRALRWSQIHSAQLGLVELNKEYLPTYSPPEWLNIDNAVIAKQLG